MSRLSISPSVVDDGIRIMTLSMIRQTDRQAAKKEREGIKKEIKKSGGYARRLSEVFLLVRCPLLCRRNFCYDSYRMRYKLTDISTLWRRTKDVVVQGQIDR